MKKLVLVVVFALLAWQGYQKYLAPGHGQTARAGVADLYRTEGPSAASSSSSRFTCDGRTHCSQMTSCEEATFFLRNCPGVKMDGNNDGIPCEKQWCR